jgi:hypothetical protein
MGSLFVTLHMRGISDDIGRENCDELAFRAESRPGGQEVSRNAQ